MKFRISRENGHDSPSASVHSTVDFPKNICMECITKLEDISLFIDIARNTDLDFGKNVSFIKVEDQILPNPEKVGEYNNEGTRYCRTCFSSSNLSSFEEKITLLQLFQEITMIDVGANNKIWNKTSICSQCTNELQKISHFKNVSITNSRLVERLAVTDTNKDLLVTNGDGNFESVLGRNVLKVKFTASDIKEGISEDGSVRNSESNTGTKVNEPLRTSIYIKEENIDFDDESSMSKDTPKEFQRTEEKPFRCDHCGKEFSRKYNMDTHLLTHSGKKAFKCDRCNKQFSIKCNLKRHLLTHTEETPFKCHHCYKGFTQECYLKTHLKTHTGEKPFKCDHCDKLFSVKGNLNRHLLTQTRETPFKCDHCHKHFNFKCNLKRHLLTHTGEKPFACYRCGKRFALKHHLNSHVLTQNHLRTHT